MRVKTFTPHLLPLAMLLVLYATPLVVYGGLPDHPPNYTPIVGIPNMDPAEDTFTFGDLINALYMLSISIAGILAVIKIVIAGIKWMTTDIVTSKEQAKKDISGALFGLVIVLAAVLILTVINRDIVDVDLSFPRVTEVGPGGV